MRLCGISSRFQLLSPCTGRVAHALLTRPPLGLNQICRSFNEIIPVRLACVKHAASVHPEPGSNSLIKCVWFGQNNYLAIHSLFTVFKGQFLEFKTFQEFSRLFHCSVIKVLKLSLCRSNSDIISQLFQFVNNFFQLFYFYLSVLFSFLRFASGFFCVSVVSSAATCYIIPPPSSDVNTYFWNFSIFLYFIFCIYFLYISDYFICIPVWPVEMFYIIGRFSFFYVLLCAFVR